MSNESHAVSGYVLCENGQHTWVLTEVAGRTGGLCSDCFVEQGSVRRSHIEVRARGNRLQLPKHPRRRRSSSSKRPQDKQAEKAKHRARKRLAAMFPDFFDILLAEERAALGLKPWTTDMAVRAHEDPDGSLTTAFAEAANDLERIGVDV